MTHQPAGNRSSTACRRLTVGSSSTARCRSRRALPIVDAVAVERRCAGCARRRSPRSAAPRAPSLRRGQRRCATLVVTLLSGRYEVLETLGAGGEARVVKALDRQHDRLVALKIRPVRDERGARGAARARRACCSACRRTRRCRSSARTSSTATTTSSRWTGSTAPTSRRCCASAGARASRRRACCAYLAEAAEALTHLHAQTPPVIHGDVKPGEPDPHPGRAGSSSSTSGSRRRRTRRGAARARRGYRAPELAAGGAPSRASDVYALAATAFALLTGAPPAGVLPDLGGHRPGAGRAARGRDPARAGDRSGAAARDAGRARRAAARRLGADAADRRAHVLHVGHRGLDGAVGARPGGDGRGARPPRRADRRRRRGARRPLPRSRWARATRPCRCSTRRRDAVAGARSPRTRALGAEPWPDGLRIAVALRAAHRRGRAARRRLLRPTRQPRGARARRRPTAARSCSRSVDGGARRRRTCPTAASLVDLGPHRLTRRRGAERIFARRRPGVDAPPPATECPYRGLLAFEADDRALLLRARGRWSADLVGRLAPGRLLARRRRLGQRQVVGAARRADRRGRRRRGARGRRAPAHDARAPSRRSTCADAPRRSLVVDQFEELFTLCDDADAARALRRRAARAPRARRDRPARRLLRRAGRPSRARRARSPRNQVLLGAMTRRRAAPRGRPSRRGSPACGSSRGSSTLIAARRRGRAGRAAAALARAARDLGAARRAHADRRRATAPAAASRRRSRGRPTRVVDALPAEQRPLAAQRVPAADRARRGRRGHAPARADRRARPAGRRRATPSRRCSSGSPTPGSSRSATARPRSRTRC